MDVWGREGGAWEGEETVRGRRRGPNEAMDLESVEAPLLKAIIVYLKPHLPLSYSQPSPLPPSVISNERSEIELGVSDVSL